MKFVGIDVSKAKLNVAILEGVLDAEYANTNAGRKALVKKLAKLGHCRVVLEPTATYHLPITQGLHDQGVPVMVANPRTTSNFAKALDQRAKTDAKDCVTLAKFAAVMEFKQWTPPTDAACKLRKRMRRRDQIVRQRTAEKVRLIEEMCMPAPDLDVVDDIKENIKDLNQRAIKMEKLALKVANSDPKLKAWLLQLVTIPGVAYITALTIVSELVYTDPEMDARQLTAYAGLDPRTWQSGNMDARRKISKRGNKRLRSALYIAAWNGAKFSPEVKQWREKLLARGKAKNVATIAVARRLLHAIVGMRSSNTDWNGAKFHQLTAEI